MVLKTVTHTVDAALLLKRGLSGLRQMDEPRCRSSAEQRLLTATYPCAGAKVTAYDLHATLKLAAPDCFSKDVIVINGEFQPTIRVRQGDILQVKLVLYNSYDSLQAALSTALNMHDLRCPHSISCGSMSSNDCLLAALCGTLCAVMAAMQPVYLDSCLASQPAAWCAVLSVVLKAARGFAQVTLHNDLPKHYPSSTSGISIHWHGLSLQSKDHSAAWYAEHAARTTIFQPNVLVHKHID